ncbi:M16 family metallopeptidase [Lysobacter sp. cf310]|uniref:M16 family metallopeptidase n=1 Tax=Lysobacter sp. cf310 TaxID=1761790 RepID=UPI0008E1D52C|nr:pitrilysin family protein [Lysobacter sp. cf310]SFK51175.1 zinc protease [Lysobacter sp. cf310]
MNAMDGQRRAQATDAVRFEGECAGLQAYRLAANGLRMLYLPMRSAPVALLMVTYEVGSRHEGEGARGVSHMLEHMMFKGSAGFDKQRGNGIHDLLLPLGAQVNATTWYDRTHYFNLVPRDRLDLVAQIEADRMSHLSLDPAQIATEKSVVLNEFDRLIGDPVEQLQLAVWRSAFPRHAYGVSVMGVREDIAGFDRERLLAHYRAHYRPDNATVTVIGDVERDPALEIVARHFGGVPSRPRPMLVERAEPEQDGERRTRVASPGAPGVVMLAYRTPAGLDPDLDALEVLGLVLAGGRSSRLRRRLVATGAASEVWSSLSRLRHPGLLQLGAVVTSDDAYEQVERALREAIAELGRDGVSGDEVARAQARIRGSLLTSRDGALAIAMQLNEAIACGDWRAYATAADRIDAVTAADVARVADRYLHDRGLTVGYLVDAAAEAQA